MKERKKPAVSFSNEDWKRLRAALENGREIEDAVLLVMVATSVRIADVLSVDLAELRAALRQPEGAITVVQKGNRRRQLPIEGAREHWQRLSDACPRGNATVAAAVCPTSSWGGKGGGGAYQRVNRHLRRLGAELDLQGRTHLHRIRRTVATRGLRATKDIKLVGDLLGHASVRSTEIYLDEPRNDEIAAVQRQLLSE